MKKLSPEEREARARAAISTVFKAFGTLVLLFAMYFGLVICSDWGGRERARRSACMNNLKQLGLGLTQYAQDHDNTYPWRVGASSPRDAWRDLGLLCPYYAGPPTFFLCPSSRDRRFEPARAHRANGGLALEPFRATGRKEIISYSYSYNRSANGRAASWDTHVSPTVLLLADKKAGVALTGKDKRRAAHAAEGRSVLCAEGRLGTAQWVPGKEALDPEPDDDEIGAPDAKDYTAWWSDPPFYGE